MKTQIITLAGHDDLISIRDRMTWAKAPRILLVWPAREQVALKPLDLRILQQHARELGAVMGLVARGEGIRRDARGFGIPVFRSTVEAQRQVWPSHSRRARRRPGSMRAKLDRILELRMRARPSGANWASSSAARMTSFVLAVVSVFSIAALFVPRATIVLTPETEGQSLTLSADVRSGKGAALSQGELPAQDASTHVSGTKTAPVQTRSEIATAKATGNARFQNLSAAPLLVPAGTIVYSLRPSLVRFVTLQDLQLDTGSNNIAEVPIEAVDAGRDGNLPAESIQGAEGSLAASVSVSNPEPTGGGTNDAQSVPSEADRQQLKAELELELRMRAQEAIVSALQEGDLLLPGSLLRQSTEREAFDPPAGQPATLLSLTLEETYRAQYVRAGDVRALSVIALDGGIPSGYVPRENTLEIQVNQISSVDSGPRMQVQLHLHRTLERRIDFAAASQMIRGTAPRQASALLTQALPLAAPPEIRLIPPWWPWLPLIPFRIALVTS